VKKKVSEIFVMAGMVLLLIYITDAAVGQGETGFLPMSEKERGMIFGLSTMILFFAAFGVGLHKGFSHKISNNQVCRNLFYN